jgi:hypothetical protein
MSEPMVKVRILQNIGRHLAGARDVEVTQSEADLICREVSINDGASVKKTRRAMLESEAQKVDELSTTGKNIVVTPNDPQYEAFLKMIKESQSKAAPAPGVAAAAPVVEVPPVVVAPAAPPAVEPPKVEAPKAVEAAPAEVKVEAAPAPAASIHPDVEPVKKEKPAKTKE